MAGIADKFDKAYEDKSLAELADAPVAALQGVSDRDAEKLQAALTSNPCVTSAPTSSPSGRKR